MDDREIRRIQLVNRAGVIVGEAIVDAADYPVLRGYTWHVAKRVYAARSVGNRIVYMHREIMAAPESLEVDHISRDTLDNRRLNLRLATRAQNGQNLPAWGKTSKYRGVYLHKPGRWRATVTVANKIVFDRVFHDEEQAALAAADARSRFMSHAVEEA